MSTLIFSGINSWIQRINSCFPHVINLAVQAFLSELQANPSAPLSSLPTNANPETIANAKRYVAALERDLVGTSRGIVSSCRASGQRRQDLRKLIEDGNNSGFWKGKMINPVHDSMPEVQLLRDCETRWSSTFNLIDRMIMLHPVRSTSISRVVTSVLTKPFRRSFAFYSALNILTFATCL